MPVSSRPDLDEMRERVADAERLLSDRDADSSPAGRCDLADALLVKADGLREVFHQRAALACAEELLTRFGASSDGALRRRLISARRVRATTLLGLRQTEEALAEAESLVASTTGQTDAELRWCLASALMVRTGALMRLGRPVEAERTAEHLSREFAGDPWQGPRRANMIGVGLLMKTEAIAAQRRLSDADRLAVELIERFMAEREPSVRSLIARAMNLRAQFAKDEGRVQEALALRRQVLEEHGHASRPGLRNVVAGVALAQAVALNELGQTDEALSVLDRTLERFASDRDPRVNPALELRAAGLKALYLARFERGEEAIRSCDSVLAGYEEAPPPDIEIELAQLLRAKASSLEDGGHLLDAIAVLDEIRARFDEQHLPPPFVARTLIQRALLLNRANRLSEEIATCREIIDKFRDAPPPETPWVALDAYHRIPFAFDALGRAREAVRACDELVEAFGDQDDPVARVAVADILSYKAHLLGKRGRIRKTLRALDAVLKRTEGSTEPKLERLARRARSSRSAILTRRGDNRRLRIAALTPLVLFTLLSGVCVRAGKAFIRRILTATAWH